jgi:SAM-dependent methyltransferase
MLKKIVKFCLSHPAGRNLNIDAPETSLLRSRIIREKTFLKQIYTEWYTLIATFLPSNINGPVVELGSGGGFLKDFIPRLITSEILKIPHVDVVLDGQFLPFQPGSLRGIVLLDVFHHFPRARSFLGQAAECVKPGGVVIMIEPWNTPWSRLIYTYLHHEPFQPKARDWHFSRGGPLSQANSALPWIVFDRDRAVFEQEFPQWHLKEIILHTPFRYLLSGGVSHRSLMPGCLFKVWRRIEDILAPCMHLWAMFATVKLERKSY